MIGQGSAAAATLFAVRHFDAADFGLMGTFAAVSIIAGTIGTGRLEAAIPIPNRDRTACAVSTLALLLLVPTSVLTVLLCLTAGPSVLHLLHASRLEDALPLAGIGAFVIGVRSILLGWATRGNRTRAISIARALNGVVMAVILVIGSLMTPEVGFLLAAWIGGQLAEGIALAVPILRDPDFRLEMNASRLRRTWRRYRRFPSVLTWGHLMDQAMNHLPMLVLAAAYSMELAGVFVVVHRLVVQPVAILGGAVSVTLVATVRGVSGRARSTAETLDRAILRLVAIAAMVFIPLAAIGPLALPAILGNRFNDSGSMLLAILPWIASDFVVLPLLPLLGFLERLGTQALGSLTRVLVIVLVLSVSAAAGAGSTLALLLLSISIATIDIGLLALTRNAARTDVRRHPNLQP